MQSFWSLIPFIATCVECGPALNELQCLLMGPEEWSAALPQYGAPGLL